jgi:RNA polymerase sigma factor (sigma-70 family)
MMIMKKSAISNEKNKTRSVDVVAEGAPDTTLVEAAQHGQSGAFAELCERYIQQLRRTAHRITRCHEDAEDAVQDALMSAFVHLRDFDGRSTFSTWLTRIAINSALMILRKKRNSVLVSMDDTENRGVLWVTHQTVDRAPNPERHYAQREREKLLNKAIRRLRPTLREVVEIQQRQDGSMRETADTIGISVTAAKARLFHAKAALRKSSVLRLMHQPRSSSQMRVWSAA